MLELSRSSSFPNPRGRPTEKDEEAVNSQAGWEYALGRSSDKVHAGMYTQNSNERRAADGDPRAPDSR